MYIWNVTLHSYKATYTHTHVYINTHIYPEMCNYTKIIIIYSCVHCAPTRTHTHTHGNHAVVTGI